MEYNTNRDLLRSEKLVAAAAKIKAIIDEYDIAAVVALHTPGHCEYIQKINPSYSCARVEDGGIVFEARKDTMGQQELLQRLGDTVNMFQILTDVTVNLASGLIEVNEFIADKVKEIGDLSHSQPVHTPGQ